MILFQHCQFWHFWHLSRFWTRRKIKPSTFVIFCLSLIRIFENGLEEEAEYILFYVTWWVIIFTETIKTSTNMLKGPRAPRIFCLVIMLSMQLSCQINLFLKPMSDMPTAYYCCSGSVQQILLPSVIKQDISWQFLLLVGDRVVYFINPQSK